MAVRVPGDHKLTAIGGEPRTMEEWLITFRLLLVVLDPYTYESSWLLQTARRLLDSFGGASVRVAWLVTADEDDAKRFLGPYATEVMTFVDPDRDLVRAMELKTLPALAFIRQDLSCDSVAEGWDPDAWRDILHEVADVTHWISPPVPVAGDPSPYPGSPALG